MKFVHVPENESTAFKAGDFSGNFGGMGTQDLNIPPSVLVFCAVEIQRRFFTLFLYDNEGGVTTWIRKFDHIRIEDGGPNQVKEIHVTGNPVVVIHDNMLKVFYAQYFEGSEPEQLFRWNTGFRLE